MKPFDTRTEFESNAVYHWVGPEIIRTCDTTRADRPKYGSLYYEDYSGFLDTAFLLRGLENVTLDFGGAVITLSGRIQPFIIDDCRNITIRNVTIAYDRPLFTEFDVVFRCGDALRIRPNPHTPCRVENGRMLPYAATWENDRLDRISMFLQAFDRDTREGRGFTVVSIGDAQGEIESPPCEVKQLRVREEAGDFILTGDIPACWDDTMGLVLAHEGRNISSVAMYHSRNILLENYRILNGAGMGILAMRTENITLDGLKLCHDGLSRGIVANAADAVHLVACEGTITIRNSIIEGMIDDALNVHANFYQAGEACGTRLTAIRDRRSHILNVHSGALAAGDEIAVYRAGTLAEKGRRTIQSATVLDDFYLALELDREIPGIEPGDAIENLSTNPALIIENCRFGKANTHLRFQTRGKCAIRNCETSLPFLLTGDMNYWFEAGPVTDMEIQKCRFIGSRAQIKCCPEFTSVPEAPFYHRNVRISDCTFDADTALIAESACDITMTGCRTSGGEIPRISLTGCENVSVLP